MAKARRGRRRPARTVEASDAGGLREHWRSYGRPKTRYPRVDDANQASMQLRMEEGVDLDPYQCTYCSGWHLGNRRE